jgi:hypothetical protein
MEDYVKQTAKILCWFFALLRRSPQEHAKPLFIKATGCESKLASILFSSFKDSMKVGLARHEIVPDLSDYGKKRRCNRYTNGLCNA